MSTLPKMPNDIYDRQAPLIGANCIDMQFYCNNSLKSAELGKTKSKKTAQKCMCYVSLCLYISNPF